MNRALITLGLAALLATGAAAQKARQPGPAKDPGRRPGQIELRHDPDQGKAALSEFAEAPVVDEAREQVIRHNIPVLEAALRTERRYVDPDHLYEKQRAMVENGERFDHALPRFTSRDGQSPEARRSGSKDRSRDAESQGSDLKLILVAAFVAASVGVYLAVARKKA